MSQEVRLYIRGPLGLWTFPLLNALVAVITSLASLRASPPQQESRPRARTYNIVRDEHGRIVSIEEIWVE